HPAPRRPPPAPTPRPSSRARRPSLPSVPTPCPVATRARWAGSRAPRRAGHERSEGPSGPATPSPGADVMSSKARNVLSRILPPPFTDMNKRSLGIAPLPLIAAVCMGAFAIGSLDLLEHRYPVSAVFPDSGGLDKGSLGRLAGVGAWGAPRPPPARG